MRFLALKQLLKGYRVAHILKGEGFNNYFLRLNDDRSITIYNISDEGFDVTQFNINDDILALLMDLEEEVEFPTEEVVDDLPKCYLKDGWRLITSNQGFMRVYVLYKKEHDVKRFTRIAYIKDVIYGVSQMTFSDELSKSIIKKLRGSVA